MIEPVADLLFNQVLPSQSGLVAMLNPDNISNYDFPIYHDVADRNAKFPYIVWHMNLSNADGVNYLREGQIELEFWDYLSTSLRSLRTIEVVKGLLENGVVRNIAGVVKGLRIRFDTEVDVPTDAADQWNRRVFFRIRGYDMAAMIAASSRPSP